MRGEIERELEGEIEGRGEREREREREREIDRGYKHAEVLLARLESARESSVKFGPKKCEPTEGVDMPTSGAELGPVADTWWRSRCRDRSNAGELRREGLARPTSCEITCS